MLYTFPLIDPPWPFFSVQIPKIEIVRSEIRTKISFLDLDRKVVLKKFLIPVTKLIRNVVLPAEILFTHHHFPFGVDGSAQLPIVADRCRLVSQRISGDRQLEEPYFKFRPVSRTLLLTGTFNIQYSILR